MNNIRTTLITDVPLAKGHGIIHTLKTNPNYDEVLEVDAASANKSDLVFALGSFDRKESRNLLVITHFSKAIVDVKMYILLLLKVSKIDLTLVSFQGEKPEKLEKLEKFAQHTKELKSYANL